MLSFRNHAPFARLEIIMQVKSAPFSQRSLPAVSRHCSVYCEKERINSTCRTASRAMHSIYLLKNVHLLGKGDASRTTRAKINYVQATVNKYNISPFFAARCRRLIKKRKQPSISAFHTHLHVSPLRLQETACATILVHFFSFCLTVRASDAHSSFVALSHRCVR